MESQPLFRQRSWLGACGALCAGAAVALAAYAGHAVDGVAQSRLQTAALFAFGHGLALTVLAPAASRTLRRLALVALFVGTMLFSGSLVLNVLVQWPTMLAPLGGALLIVGWIACAIDLLRR